MDIGAQLRASREALGVSLDALAAKTRVQPRILAAIERNDIRSLPPKPYGRGFVRTYAKEIGHDPDETVREYFGQFPPPVPEPLTAPRAPARQAPSAWLWLAGTGMSVLLLVLWSVGSSSTQERTTETVVGTSGTEPAAPTPVAGKPLREPSETDTVAGVPRTVTVLLTATRDCWVTATADGERVIFRLLHAGSKETLRGDREVVIRAGDAGALSLTINGRDAGAFGAPGEVRTERITPADVASRR